jgi:arylsulfatase
LAATRFSSRIEFIREKAGPHGDSLGKTTLYVNEEVAAQGDMKTQLGKFTLSIDGLCIGRDSGDAVSEECKLPGAFKNGRIKFVGVTVEKGQYIDLEKLAVAAFAVD